MTNEYRGVPLYGHKATGDPVSLDDHEAASQARYESVIGCIEDVKENVLEVKAVLSAGAGAAEVPFVNKLENKMGVDNVMDKINLNVGESSGGAGLLPMAAMAMMGNNRGIGGGAALGAGAAGLLAGALLGGNGGLFGGRNDGGFNRDSAPLNGTDGMAIIGAIGNVKDVVGASTASVTATVTSGNQMLGEAICQGFAASAAAELQQTIMLSQQANANQIMLIQGIGAVAQGVADQGCRTREAICTDGTATRALITQLNTDNLNRLLTVADLDRRDEANRGRSREVEVNVSQVVNQAQAQAQQQQQQQQIVFTLANLAAQFGTLQNAVATNSNLIIGNTGATTTGAQTANPVNVRA